MKHWSSKWRLPELESAVLAFERLLRTRFSMTVPPKTPLERICLSIMEMQAVFAKQAVFNDQVDHRQDWREAVGLADVVMKSLHHQAHADFAALAPHFRLLADAESQLVQNVRSAKLDPVSNKLFELLIALAAMKYGRAVDLDHPHCSTGRNPDVLVDFFGNRWGLACKVPFNNTAKTFADNVRKAVDQIERSVATHGLVVVNLKNVLNHDALWPAHQDQESKAWTYYPAATERMATQALQLEAERMEEAVWDELGGEEGVMDLFAGKKAAPAIVTYSSTLLGVHLPGSPVVTTLRTLTVWNLLHTTPITREVERVADALARGLQDP